MTLYQVVIYLAYAIDAIAIIVLSYRCKSAAWQAFGMGVCCNILTVLWLLALRTFHSDREVFVGSLLWDVITACISTLVPLVCYKFRIDARLVAGIIAIVIGLFLLKTH